MAVRRALRHHGPVQRFGNYRLDGELARGAMGVVFRALSPSGEPVALKVLNSVPSREAHALRRFQREVQALAKLEHPRILRLRDAGFDPRGRAYIVTDLIEGYESLATHLARRGTLPPRRVARLGLELARALDHAHARGVLHRDLKPDNVLLDAEGHPLLIDFGLCGSTLGRGSLTQSGVFFGTPSYWPPEQARGEIESLGPPADVYSLGATLYALLTGTPPFVSGSLIESVQATLEQTPTPPSRFEASVDPDLEAIVLRCLRKAPAERFTSAADLADALEDCLASARRVRARQSWALPVGAGVGLVLLAGALAAGVALRPARDLAQAPPSESPAPAQEAPALAPPPSATPRGEAPPTPPTPPPAPRAEGPSPGARAEAERHFLRAKSLLGRSPAECLDALGQALAIDSEHAEARAFRAITYLYAGREAEALEDATRVLAMPGASEQARSQSLYVRGRERARAGDAAMALPDFDAVLALEPTFPQARLERAVVRLKLGETAGAVSDADLALELGLSARETPMAQEIRDRFGSQLTAEELARAYAALEDELRASPSAHQRLEAWLAARRDR